MSTVPWIPGNILGTEKVYLENPWINFGTGIPWKKFPGHFKYLDSLEKFVVVVAALADGCSFPELQSSTFLLLFQFVNWQHCMIKWVFFVETNELWCALNHKRGLFKHVKSFVADLEMCVDHNYFMCDNDYRCPTFVIKDKWTASFLEVGKYEPLLYRDS